MSLIHLINGLSFTVSSYCTTYIYNISSLFCIASPTQPYLCILHIDQNEKLVMFGVVHVLAVDGYSKKIVSLVTMPRKNCVVIYDHNVSVSKLFFTNLYTTDSFCNYLLIVKLSVYLAFGSNLELTMEQSGLSPCLCRNDCPVYAMIQQLHHIYRHLQPR